MKLYVYIALIAAVAGGLWYAHHLGYEAGEAEERVKWQDEKLALQDEVNAERDRKQELITELQQREVEREVVYRDRVKVVRKVVDECLDTRMPDDILRVLNEDGVHSREAGLEPDERL